MSSNIKLLVTWIIGGLFLLAAIWIVQNLELNVGVSATSYATAMLIALLFILIAGFAWISVAVGTKKHFF